VCPPLITVEPIGGSSWNLVDKWCHWRWPRFLIFNLVALAIPQWRTFKLLRWVQRNPLITSESIGGFGWNLVWRWWHWSWSRLHTIYCRNCNHSKMAEVETSEVGVTFEPIFGFGWYFVWRWWHWIMFIVSLCRESRHISSFQNFLFQLQDRLSCQLFMVLLCPFNKMWR
jgi:hypothetical protein